MSVGGRIVLDPEFPTAATAVIVIDNVARPVVERVHVALNKPRGLVTTTVDEHGRDTVYRCFDGSDLPWLAPIGRLDKASEGLLLFCNDPQWSARISDPHNDIDKTYHAQIDTIPTPERLASLVRGIEANGVFLRAKSVQVLRTGGKNSWLEIVLDEGRNRQIRRLLAAFEINVLRLVRVAIGTLALGDLPKGQWRRLDDDEVRALACIDDAKGSGST